MNLAAQFEWIGLTTAPMALVDQDRLRIEAAISAGRPIERRATGSSVEAGVAVIPVMGLLVQRPSILTAFGIATSLQVVSMALQSALTDPAVGAVLLEFDSFGGSVYGIQELGEQIYLARNRKPIAAVANSVAASGAYWLATQAAELYVTPGGEVGGIGVTVTHVDESVALAKAGMRVTLIRAGKYKTEGNSCEPLADDARHFMQSRVNDYYQAFIRGVARGRGVSVDTVRSCMGQGRVLGEDDARRAVMVDGVATRDQVLRKLANSTRRVNDSQAGRRPVGANEVNGALHRLMLNLLTDGG